MKTIESSNDIKKCMAEVKQHLSANEETVNGNKEADIIMIISREFYDIRSGNLSYNEKIEFAFQCDSSSKTQLFTVA